MPIKTAAFPLKGGLNLDLANSEKPPGFTIYQHNFETVFGKQGYHRVGGLQRFDGRARIQDGTYGLLTIKAETTTINVGVEINLDDNTNEVTVLARDGNTLIVPVYPGTPTWAADEPVRFGLVQFATVDSFIVGGPADATFDDYILPAQQWQRDQITAPLSQPTGLHAWRDDVFVAQANGNVARSGPTGWTTAVNNLIAGAEARFVRHNFGGATETLGLFCADGRNRPWRYNVKDGFSQCAPMVQTNATSASSVTMGAGNKSFVVIEDNRAWEVDQAVTVWANTDRAKFMSGVVVSWTPGTNTVVINITEANGHSDTLTAWEIGLSDFSDKPYDLVPYGTRMAYAFSNGQLLLSDIGEPFTFTTTSLLLGVGDEITGIVPLKGGPLAVFCSESIYLLSGVATDQLRLQVHSYDTGAKRFSAVGAGGNVIFLSERGITSLAASEAFGDFQLGLSSGMINDLIQDALPRVAFVKLHKTKMQYRIYLNDGTGLAMTFLQEAGILGLGPVAFSTFSYPVTLVCGASGERSTGQETQFVAGSDGRVYEEDAGINFDGAPIYAYMHTAFWALGDGQYKKRFRKVTFEVDSPYPIEFDFRLHFDGMNRYYQPGKVLEAASFTGGSVWDGGDWNQFIWSGELFSEAQVNVQGVGRNAGLLMWSESATADPFVIQSVGLQFTPLGIQR